jgi:hypothetical protein
MPAAAKKTPRAKKTAAPRARPAPRAKTKAKAAPSQPFLRFHISAALRDQILAVLTRLEKSKKPGEHRAALMDIVVALNDAGTSYYFMRPLGLMEAGFAVEQLARLSTSGNQALVASAIRLVMGRLDDRQLLFVCQYIRQLMA